MILKSFYRKKTTMIYLFIFILLFSALAILNLGKKYYANEYDINYQKSFTYLPMVDNIDVEVIPNIKTSLYVLSDGMFFYAQDNSIKQNEIAFPNFLSNGYPLQNEFIFKGKNNAYPFIIASHYDQPSRIPLMYLNNDDFNTLKPEADTLGYILTFKQWSKRDITADYLAKNYNIQTIIWEITDSEIDFTTHIRNFTIFVYLTIFIFVIVCLLTINNILIDEKEKNYIYRSIGYSNKKVFKLQLINITSLLIFAFISSALLIVIIKIIFKI